MSAKMYFAAALVAVALTGCAVGRDEIKLANAPLTAKTQMASKGRSVFIRSVADQRVFAKGSPDPSTPSLSPEGDTPDVRARAVSRKRNGYGMALGDVTLAPGQTVAGQVSDALQQAFRQAGYTVVTEAGAAAPIIVDVRIKKFWSWTKPGFSAITLVSDIDTELTITAAKAAPAAISAHVEDAKLVGGANAHLESLQKALTAYRAEAVTKLADLKF